MHKESSVYSKADGILAVAVFILNEVSIYFWTFSSLGKSIQQSVLRNSYDFFQKTIVSQEAGRWANKFSYIPFYYTPVVLIVIILLVRKQKFSSLGFQKHHNFSASLIGIGAGILIALFMYGVLFFCGKPNVFSNLQRLNFSVPVLLSNIILTGLTEELCYRAYIQSRITGLIKNQWIAIILVGLMFWASHFIRNYADGGPIGIDILLQGFIIVCAHIVFLFLYRKTGNILTVALCHGIYDFIIVPIYF